MIVIVLAPLKVPPLPSVLYEVVALEGSKVSVTVLPETTVFRTDAKAIADDQHTNHQYRINRRPARITVERRQVLAGWNATEAEYPKQKCIHELFEAQVGKSLDARPSSCGNMAPRAATRQRQDQRVRW